MHKKTVTMEVMAPLISYITVTVVTLSMVCYEKQYIKFIKNSPELPLAIVGATLDGPVLATVEITELVRVLGTALPSADDVRDTAVGRAEASDTGDEVARGIMVTAAV